MESIGCNINSLDDLGYSSAPNIWPWGV